MNTRTLFLKPSRNRGAAVDIGTPMLGRAWALMSQAGARRAAADLRRQAAISGTTDAAQSRELLALASAVEACKA